MAVWFFLSQFKLLFDHNHGLVELRISPVSAAGQEVNARKDGIGQPNACGKVGVAHFNRMSHNCQIDEHYNRVEHMHHNVQGVDLVMLCEKGSRQEKKLEMDNCNIVSHGKLANRGFLKYCTEVYKVLLKSSYNIIYKKLYRNFYFKKLHKLFMKVFSLTRIKSKAP